MPQRTPRGPRSFDLGRFTGKRLLIVDDEPDQLAVLSALLEDEYEVRTALRAEEALAIVEREELDVVLSDQRMPGMQGVEFLRRCAELQPDVVRIMVTAYSDTMAMIGAINEGEVYRFLAKPWSPDALLEMLRGAVELRAYRRAVQHLILELQAKNTELEASLETLRRTQEQLLHSERLATIGQLTSGVVHEIRNHLSGLQALVDAVGDEEAADDTHFFLDLGIKALSRVYHVLDDLHRFARRDPEWCHLPTRGDLNEVVREAVRLARLDRRLKTAVVRETYGELPPALMDAAKVRQVVMNLLRNATDALPRTAAEVHVTTLNGEGEVRLVVEDNGSGIREADLPRIWEPFFSTKHKEGLGLGLHVCREIVTAHGGRIFCESREGGGTRFVVTLPAL